MEWTWTIYNFDPYVNYALKEIARWVAENAVTIFVLTTIFTWLQNQATRLEAVTDNARLSLLGYYMVIFSRCMLYIVSFKWLTQFRQPKIESEKVDEKSTGTT